MHGYYASRYVPERTIVAIVGAVDPDQALALARETYGDWPAAPGAVDPSPEEPAHREVRARTLRGDVAQAELSLGWRAALPLAPDAPALDLAAAVLGAGRGSWLYRELREPGLVTWVDGPLLRAHRARAVRDLRGARAGARDRRRSMTRPPRSVA